MHVRLSPSVLATCLVVTLMLGTGGVRLAAAQTIWVSVKAADDVLVDTPVMVSAILDGEIVHQYEKLLVKSPNTLSVGLDGLQPGTYDIRIEGDGIVTEVKRGVQLLPDRNAELSAVVRPGSGVHIVEYAIGGLAREEVAARLMQLEAAVTELRAAQQGQ